MRDSDTRKEAARHLQVTILSIPLQVFNLVQSEMPFAKKAKIARILIKESLDALSTGRGLDEMESYKLFAQWPDPLDLSRVHEDVKIRLRPKLIEGVDLETLAQLLEDQPSLQGIENKVFYEILFYSALWRREQDKKKSVEVQSEETTGGEEEGETVGEVEA